MALALIAFCAASCAAVDQFGSRINDNNLNSQDAMNREILLNIIRASHYQSLNFIGISQISGGQTETLTTGLPTITFGPGQTAAQHQSVITNSVSSGVTGGFQSSPLISSAFQEGMLRPIDPKVLAMLVAAHPREPVLYAVLDRIEMSTGKTTFLFRNDPSNDEPDCRTEVARFAREARLSVRRKYFLDDQHCNFSKFVLFLQTGLTYGLTAELVSSSSTPKGSGAPARSGGARAAATGGGNGGANNSNNATASAQVIGQFCFDPGLAIPARRAGLAGISSLCGGGKPFPANKRSNAFRFNALGLDLQFVLFLRSPNAVFSYLGELQREGRGNSVYFITPETKKLKEGVFLEIVSDGSDCYTSVSYDGQFFCVPRHAYNTAMLIDILEQLRNLSITPSDLNSAFSVRLVN